MFWSVIRIQSREMALRNLGRMGLEPFYPSYIEKRAKRGVVVPVDVPLFSTYCFVFLPEDIHWPKLNNVHGCGKLMTKKSDWDEYHEPVDVSKFVEQLKGCTTLEGTDKWTLAPGTKVTVLAGPFKGHVGEISKMNGTERVHLLLWLLGRENTVIVSRLDVAPVE